MLVNLTTKAWEKKTKDFMLIVSMKQQKETFTLKVRRTTSCSVYNKNSYKENQRGKEKRAHTDQCLKITTMLHSTSWDLGVPPVWGWVGGCLINQIR